MLSWIAGAIELTASWCVGNKKRFGFILNIICEVLWIIVAIQSKVYGLLLVVVPAMFINTRNYFKWKGVSK